MKPGWRLSQILIGAVLVSSAACGDRDGNPITIPAVKPETPAPTVVALQVIGFAPFVGTAEPFQASVTLSDGSTEQVTSKAVWRSSNPAVASVDSTGVVTGLASGETDITVTYRTALTVVRITLSDAAPVLSEAIVDLSGGFDQTTRRLGALDCGYSMSAPLDDRWCFSAFGSSYAGKQVPSFDYKVVAGSPVYAASAGAVIAIFPHEEDGAFPGEYTIHVKPTPASPYTVQYDHVKNLTIELGSVVAPGMRIGTAGMLRPGSGQGRVELQVIKTLSFRPSVEVTSLCPASFGTPEFNALNDAARTAHNLSNPQYGEGNVCMATAIQVSIRTP